MFALAIFWTLEVAAPLLIPVTFSVVLYFLLAPLTKMFRRLGMPRPAAAVGAIAVPCGILVAAILTLSEPATEWLRSAPTSLSELREDFRKVSEPLEQMRDASEAVEEVVGDLTGTGSETVGVVTLSKPGLLEAVIAYVPAVLAGLGLSFALCLLLLISGRPLICALLTSRQEFGERRRAIETVRAIETDVSRYLGAVTTINISLGAATTLVLWAFDMPTPYLWGAVAAILNFAPFIGAVATTGLLAVVGMSSFDTLPQAIAPAMAFLALTVIEGYVVTPLILGQRLSFNAFLALLAVAVFGWLWGLAGALIAVPVLRIILVLWGQRSGRAPVPGTSHRGEHVIGTKLA
jgi:predicted PurR-regulated permease PerM